jgi:hypothetical protein
MVRYKRVRENGHVFVFKYEDDPPGVLHIFARHLTEIDDALDVFFSSEPSWNEELGRFENQSDTHGLYWFWLDEGAKVVMVISCFRLL